jgi:hypothetical protein
VKAYHFCSAIFLIFCCAVICHGQENNARGLPHVQLQVAALVQIQDFQFTAEQLKDLKKIAGELTPGKVTSAGRLRADYSVALSEYRRALIEGDPEKMATAQQKVQEARDKEKIDPEPTIEISATARRRASEVLDLLTPVQVAGYIANHVDEVPDPVQTMLDSLEELPGKSDAEYETMKKSVTELVAILMHGMNSSEQSQTIEKVGAWLDSARAINETELASHHTVLEKAARDIVGHTNSMDCLRHWIERDLADLLSNPDLPRVLTERIRTAAR